jgi:hypothetical protein
MDIEHLARKAGGDFPARDNNWHSFEFDRAGIARFTALVLEEAAKAVELPAIADADLDHDEKGCYHCGLHDGRSEAAEAIRALIPSTPVPATDRQ